MNIIYVRVLVGDMTRDSGKNVLGTTATSLEILRTIETRDGAGVTVIADRMNIPKSTVHGHLATLESDGFLVNRGGNYHLGPELLRLGHKVRTRERSHVLAREFTETLFDRSGFRSIFVVEMGGRAVFLHTASGEKTGWAHEQIGNRLYLHSTAVGKAILAELPVSRIERSLDRWGLPAETEYTITNREDLFEELETVRERGYATNHQENIEGLHGIGAAATDDSGSVVGAFSITGPKHAFTGDERERELADVVTDLTGEYELEVSLA